MVGSVIPDVKDKDRLYVGIVNDKVHGGMFTTNDVGKTWLQVSKGLGDRDILSLDQAENGVLFAGTNHGIFFLNSLVGTWQPAAMIRGPVPEWQPKAEPAPPPPAPATKSKKGAAATARKPAARTAKAKVPVEVPIPIAIAPRVRSLR